MTAAELLPTASGARTWAAVRVLARPKRVLATGAVVVLVAATVAGLVVPPTIGHIVDLVQDGRGPSAITAPVVILVVAAVAQSVLSGLGAMLVARLGETLLAELRERVVRRALGLPLAQVERAGSGDLVARVSGDVAVIANAVRSAIPELAGAALTVALTIVGLAALDWRFALAGLLAAPVQWFALRWYLSRSTPLFARQRVVEGARTQQLLDSVGGADTVRAFRISAPHVEAVTRRSGAAVDLEIATMRVSTRFFGRLNLAEFVGLTAILLTGFWLVRDGAASVGAAAAAALYFHRLFDPVNILLGLFGTAQEAAAGLARLVGIVELPGELADGEPAEVPRSGRSGDVRVETVCFGYAADRPVLRDVSLHLRSGERVAVVGGSGAGKTTLARLVAGVHPATTGVVRLDGVGLDDLPPATVRREVVLVTQEVHVFAGTVADDLRLAAPQASDDDLLAALDRVSAREWVDRLPDGLATVVGEGGHRLSPAEAQHLALARLVLADPPVAVLDEATADAGSAGARLLDRAADAALEGRSALVVAHRLSQAAVADRVVVLEGGRVVEAGPHDELVAAGGRYAQLWEAWSGSREG